jgi:YidC/Oxa1 family membrane protein insertase
MSVSADKNQRMIFLALPFVFIPFVINFPAGLLVYWITTNLWTIVQQFIVRRTVGPVRPPISSDDAEAKESGRTRRAPAAAQPAAATASGGGARRTTAPPPPPSKRKKKRSGRRR